MAINPALWCLNFNQSSTVACIEVYEYWEQLHLLLCRKWLLKLHGIEELSHVPLYQHVVTTVTGRTTIQAFSKAKDFIAE